MKKTPRISDAEFEVMEIIWQYAPINTNGVTELLTQTANWSPKTIQTMLRRLVNKKVLTYEKQGRIFVYTPLVTKESYLQQESHCFLSRYFHGDLTAMVSSYLDHGALSEHEVESLKQLLANSFDKGGH